MLTHNDPDNQERDNKAVITFMYSQKLRRKLGHCVEQLLLKIRGCIVPDKTLSPVDVEESELNSEIVSEGRLPFCSLIHSLIPNQYACS